MDPQIREFIQIGVLVAGFAITIWNTNKAAKTEYSADEVTRENHALRISSLEKEVDNHTLRITKIEDVQKSIDKLESYSKDQSKDLKDLKTEVNDIKVELAKGK